eukprot:gene15058-21134_t
MAPFDMSREYARASAEDKRSFAGYNKAAGYANNGQFEQSKDMYRSTFEKSSLQFALRFHMFQGFTSILRYNEARPSAQDIAFLKRVAKNEIATKETALYQIDALFTLGLCAWDQGDREKAGRRYRKGLDIRNAMTNADLAAKVIWRTPETALMPFSAATILETPTRTMKENLSMLEGRPITPSTCPYTTFRTESIPIGTGATPEDHALVLELMSKLNVPGSQCDQCKISREEAPSKLLLCGKCKRVYFCSAACQKLHWKEGHKLECREPKDFRSGDIVRLFGMSNEQYNGKMVRVLGKAEKEGRWKLAMIGETSKEVSIHQDNMEMKKPVAQSKGTLLW